MVCLQTQKSEFGYILESLAMYVRCCILWTFDIFNAHLFIVILYISPRFGILYQEKSGNPAQ
jgi:hypothetical protein